MKQFLSRVFEGLGVDFIQHNPYPERGEAWAHLPKHIPTSLFLGTDCLLLLLFFKFECGANAFREFQREGMFGN